MKKITLLGIIFTIVLVFTALSGCSALDQRLADGTAVAGGQSVDSPFSQEDGSGGGEAADEAVTPPTATLTPTSEEANYRPTFTTDPGALGTMVRETVNAKASQTMAVLLETQAVPDADEPVAESTATLDDANFTQLAQTLTVMAMLTNPAGTAAPAEATEDLTTTPTTPTATPDGPTNTPEATDVPCNAFRFVAHVSYPPYSTVQASTEFWKSWQIQNTGSCTWSGSYALVYYGGFQLSGPSPFELGDGVVVHPGQYVTVSVPLFTMPQPGTYESNWVLQDANGNAFGGGESGGEPLTAVIIVPGVQNPVFTSPASTAPPFYTSTPSP